MDEGLAHGPTVVSRDVFVGKGFGREFVWEDLAEMLVISSWSN